MAGCGSKFNKIDANRYRRCYPYLRRRPRQRYVSDQDAQIEYGELSFTNESGPKTFTFDQAFPSRPAVVATAGETPGTSADPGSSNVNVFISSISTTDVTIRVSQNFTGVVYIQAIWLDCT